MFPFVSSPNLRVTASLLKDAPMDTYELRQIDGGFELRWRKLEKPMIYRETEPQPAINLVGFLSQKDGSELRMFDLSDKVIFTRRFQGTVVTSSAVAGLAGP